MSGVLFTVTIPTEQEEQSLKQHKKTTTVILKSEKEIQESDIYENGAFKIASSSKGLLIDNRRDEFENYEGLLNISQDSSMESIMNELFRKLKIENSVWQLSKNGRFYQITFSVESNARHELVLSTLNEWGIGQRNDSCVCMIPCAIFNQSSRTDGLDARTESIAERKQTAWHKFVSSMHARHNVAKIVKRVKEDATLTFDCVTLILVAGTLAAFGLLENDPTTVTSSMLISPLMGPIIATIFGIVIKDRALIRFALINEVIGILLATLIGFVLGLIICTIDSEYAYGSKEALTKEMIKRCENHSLWIGFLTALPTGAAAAIAVLSDNFGSLVGVAISVSLLPPAVNAGVFWALAVLYKLNENDMELYSKVVSTNMYSNHQSIELAVYGAKSLLLTVVNVLAILLVGVLTLKIKEVVPLTRNQRQLWKHDIKVVRDFNQTSGADANEDQTSKQMADELSNLRKKDESIRSMYRDSYQSTWSPMSSELGGIDSIFHMGQTQASSQFDEPRYLRSNVPKRRNTMPSQFSSHISSLRAVNRFQLEKIPEVVVTSSNGEGESNKNNNQPGSSSQLPTYTIDST